MIIIVTTNNDIAAVAENSEIDVEGVGITIEGTSPEAELTETAVSSLEA